MPEEEEQEDEPRQTDPRFWALAGAAQYDTRCAQAMVEADPSVLEARHRSRETALQHLVILGNLGAVEWLLERGAAVDTRNHAGHTPLMDAALLGNLEMCRLLVAWGADVRLRSDSGDTALSWAAGRRGNLPVVEFLLGQLGPGEDVNDLFDDTWAEMTLDRRRSRASRLLRERGLRRRFGRKRRTPDAS